MLYLQGKQFRVAVVDSRPENEGRIMLKVCASRVRVRARWLCVLVM